MPRLMSAKSLAGKLGGAAGGAARPMFIVSGLLFNSKEIETLLDRKARITMERIGRLLRRSARKSLKYARRYRSISSIPTSDPYYKRRRQILRINQWEVEQGRRASMPPLPWITSKSPNIPKVRRGRNGEESPLKKGMLFDYERMKKNVVVGPARMRGTKGKAPSVLEHGGVSNRTNIAARHFMRKTLMREKNNGKIKETFKKSIK